MNEEKRFFLSISNICNNRCMFCLASDVHKNRNYFESFEDLKLKILNIKNPENTKLIISGMGEASIHPDFLRIVNFAKKNNFKKIQTISNGRMFSNEKFVKLSKISGLDEITFSVHGHNSEIHDKLVGVNGSFNQIVLGIKNAQNLGFIVNVDIVLNKINIEFFDKIIEFLLNIGIREFDILSLIPFGRAWEQKDELFFDLENYKNVLRRGIKLAISKNSYVWTNRMPACFLEDFESLIQSPEKLIDEINGRKSDFDRVLLDGDKLYCFGEKCKFCSIEDLCSDIYFFNENKNKLEEKTKKITILELENLKSFEDVMEIDCYDFLINSDNLNFLELRKIIKKYPKFKYFNLPFCVSDFDVFMNNDLEFSNRFLKNGKLDVFEVTNSHIKYKKLLSKKCLKCIKKDKCGGFFYSLVKKYGFKKLEMEIEK